MGDTVPDVPDLDSRTLQVARRALEDGSITLEQLISALRAMWLDRSAPDDLLAALVLGEAVQPDQAVRLNRMVEIGADDDDPAIFLPDPKQRYEPGDLLGSGGMGVVQLVHDRNLGRDVAMKRLHADLLGEDESMGALIMEARVAGMLEHPNIIPVYDVGLTGNDEPFYTMRLMDQLSLGDVLRMLRRGNPEAAREYPLVRLLKIFQAVAMGVDYAHSRGVIHRDLKPDNIRLGTYGEVQVADWGLARIEGWPDLPLRKALREAAERGDDDPCIVVGSPNYMSPEQACGENDSLGATTDIYSLGVILYEILTFQVPHEAVDTMVLLDAVEHEEVVAPSVRAPDRVIPPELEEVCMAALEKRSEDRIQTARELWRAVEDYLVGHHEQSRADEHAFEQIQRGHRYGAGYFRLREVRDRLRGVVASVSDSQYRRQLERELLALELDIVTAWGNAYDAYVRALGFDPSDLVARAKVAELAWTRLQDAEAAGEDIPCQVFWSMLQRHNDGAYDRYIVGESTLSLRTEPAGATLHVQSYSDDDAVRRKGPGRAVGRAPLEDLTVPAGLHLVTAELEGHRPVSRPVFVHARARRDVELVLPPG